MTTTEHPARVACKKSMSAVTERRRDDWFALFADDAVIEDPVGPSGFDPTGAGHHGAAGIAAFWDMSIGLAESITFDIRDSFACGDEVANVGTITTLIGGQRIDAEGVFVYRVNPDGKIASLRAFWEVERAMATAKPVS